MRTGLISLGLAALMLAMVVVGCEKITALSGAPVTADVATQSPPTPQLVHDDGSAARRAEQARLDALVTAAQGRLPTAEARVAVAQQNLTSEEPNYAVASYALRIARQNLSAVQAEVAAVVVQADSYRMATTAPTPQAPPPATPAPGATAASTVVPPPIALTASGGSADPPVTSDPELMDFLGRWVRSIRADAQVASLDTFYGPQVSWHSAQVTGEHIRDEWVSKRQRVGSLDITWERSTLRHEDPSANGTARPCRDLPGATGDILLTRAWAIEVEPDRSPRIGCARLEGVYLIRSRRTPAGLRICHETWSLRDGICVSCPTASMCPAGPQVLAAGMATSGGDPSRPPSRMERDLAACDAYVAEVRRRRAQLYRLQRSGSDRFQEVVERNQAWLAHQETGPFGRAMADLRALMEHWQAQEDDGANTIHSRAQLMREVSTRCQP